MAENVASNLTVIAPLYKGLIHTDDPAHVALFQGTDLSTGEGRVAYLDRLNDARSTASELTQDIARTAAAALYGVDLQRQGQTVNLVAVEGCLQQIGDRRLHGGQIIERIWKDVVPREIVKQLPAPIIQTISGCVIEEVRAVLDELRKLGGGNVVGVTHEYHAARVAKMLGEEVGGVEKSEVLTPEEIIQRVRADQPFEKFVVDLVRASAPTREVIQKEEKDERIFGPLHKLSRVLEKCSFGGFNLEIFLANRLRKRKQQKLLAS